jgi:hypothetical protein
MTTRREEFLKWKFGMFVSFDLITCHEREWGNGYEDPLAFAPSRLDCDQWVAAARSAGMRYLVLTTKHTAGWCLWPSAYTRHGIASALAFRNGQGDIVGEFVAACRRHQMKVGLYYCGPGRYAGQYGAPMPPAGKPDLLGMPPEAAGDLMGFVRLQILELLERYGPIDLFWWDQFSSADLKREVQARQPDCLVLVNNASDPAVTDITGVELPVKLAITIPEDNATPSEACDCLTPGGWFWKSMDDRAGLRGLMSAGFAVERLVFLNRRRCNYLLNVPPDRNGLISPYCQQRLAEIGALRGLLEKPHGEAATVIIQMLGAEDPDQRLLGVEAARLVDELDPARRTMLERLAQADPEMAVRVGALRALGRSPAEVDDPGMRDWLRKTALTRPGMMHTTQVEQAVETYAKTLTPEQRLPWLIELLRVHDSHRITHPAAYEIARMRPTPATGVRAVLDRRDNWLLSCLDEAEPTPEIVALMRAVLDDARIATSAGRLLLKWQRGGEAAAVERLCALGDAMTGTAFEKGESRRELVFALARGLASEDEAVCRRVASTFAAWMREITGYTRRCILQALTEHPSLAVPYVDEIAEFELTTDQRLATAARTLREAIRKCSQPSTTPSMKK